MLRLPASKLLAAASLIAVAALGLALRRVDPGVSRIDVLCAVVAYPRVQAAAVAYGRAHGVQIVVQAGGSGALVNQLRISGVGDVFIPAAASYLDDVQVLVATRQTLGCLQPVLGVPAGNPLGVSSLRDAVERRLRVGFANPETAAIGRIARGALQARGDWDQILPGITVMKPTVGDIAADLQIGAVDVAVVWDATVASLNAVKGAQEPIVDAIHDPIFADSSALIAGATLTTSNHPELAEAFLTYLAETARSTPVEATP